MNHHVILMHQLGLMRFCTMLKKRNLLSNQCQTCKDLYMLRTWFPIQPLPMVMSINDLVFSVISGTSWIRSKSQFIMAFDDHFHVLCRMHFSFLTLMIKLQLKQSSLIMTSLGTTWRSGSCAGCGNV